MLIINDKIRQLMKGYPTVSDKYNVAGGILTGNYPVEFGDLVKLSGTTGYFEAVNSTNTITNVNELGGFVLATNVKLATDYPGTIVEVNPGEAFNLLVNGFMAVQLAEGAVTSEITANAPVFVTAAGKATTTGDGSKLGANPIPNTVFTGLYETIAGTTYAEIYVK